MSELEEIKDKSAFDLGDVKWLIQRVEELEQVTKRQLYTIGYHEELTYRYKQALEEIKAIAEKHKDLVEIKDIAENALKEELK